MKSQNNKPKFKMSKKQIIISIISLLVIVGITVPIIVFSIPKDPIINDLTDNTPEAEDVLSEGVVDNHAEAILSPNISLYDTEESKAIESSILSVSQVDTNLVLDVNKGSPMESLEKGDVFFIQGTTDSFLGEAYFGKVSSKIEQEGYYTYAIETPMIDEVFDYIDIDYSQDMSYSNISNIETPEGVTVSAVDNLSSKFNMNSGVVQTGSLSNTNITLLSTTSSSNIKTLGADDKKDDIYIEFNLDIIKLLRQLGVIPEKENVSKDDPDLPSEGVLYTVYYTNTGLCYHTETCHCLTNSKYSTSISGAKSMGLRACKICNPFDGSWENESSLTLSGKVGLEDLMFSIMSEGDAWTIEKGFENLSIKTEGNFIAEAKLAGDFEFEFSGDETKIVVGKDEKNAILTLEGLKQKLFPIAFISYDGTWNVKIGPNSDKVDMPLTIGLMIYTDIYGNITAGAEVYCSYTQPIEYNFDVFKDGKFLGIGATDNEEEPTTSEDAGDFNWGLKIEAKADVDFQALGGSVMLYVGNMNVLELSLVRFGAEAQGTLAFDSSEYHNDNYGFSAQGKVCIYAELLELDLKVKAKTKWGLNGAIDANLGPWKRWELGKFGNTDVEASTHFNSSTMYVNNIIAGDSKSIYYKDEQGNLIAEKDSYKTVIYDDEFFVICGIDDSYIYLLKRSENNSSLYDLYRIRKDGTSERRIVEEIKNFMECDETYFYYTLGDDTQTIMRLRRSDLEEESFASFDAEVAYMKKQNDGFYVETTSGFWFLTTIKYYLLNSNGEIVEHYGENPAVSQYLLYEYDDFYMATKIVSNGFLRDTASEIYWLSLDKQNYVKAESLAGWTPSEEYGIFVLTDGDENHNYQIKLYCAENGELVSVVGVNSNQAHFTMVQDDYGTWYYIDETETGLTLYAMNENFENRRIIEELSYEEFPVNLETCGMILMDGTIWFYEMPDEYTANVLYRYSLY